MALGEINPSHPIANVTPKGNLALTSNGVSYPQVQISSLPTQTMLASLNPMSSQGSVHTTHIPPQQMESHHLVRHGSNTFYSRNADSPLTTEVTGHRSSFVCHMATEGPQLPISKSASAGVPEPMWLISGRHVPWDRNNTPPWPTDHLRPPSQEQNTPTTASHSSHNLYPLLTPLVPTAPPARAPSPPHDQRFCWPGQAWLGPSGGYGDERSGSVKLSATASEDQQSSAITVLKEIDQRSSVSTLNQIQPPVRMKDVLPLSPHDLVRGRSTISTLSQIQPPTQMKEVLPPSAHDLLQGSSFTTSPTNGAALCHRGNLSDTSGGGDSPTTKPPEPEKPPPPQPPDEPPKPVGLETLPFGFIPPRKRRPRRSVERRSRSPPPRQRCVLCINWDVTCFFLSSLSQFLVGTVAFIFGAIAMWDKQRIDALSRSNNQVLELHPITEGLGLDMSGRLEDFNTAGLVKSGSVALIVGGACIVILGFLGCCGVLMRSKPMILSYGIIVLLVALAQITAAGLALSNKEKTKESLRQSITEELRLSYTGRANSSSLFSQTLDLVQITFECCGVNGPHDFKEKSPWWLEQQHQNCSPCAEVPATCCKLMARETVSDTSKAFAQNYTAAKFHLQLKDPMCPFTKPGPENPNTNNPCFDVLMKEVTKHIVLVLIIGILVLMAEMSAICSSFKVVTLLVRNDELMELQELRNIRRFGRRASRASQMHNNDGSNFNRF